MDLLAGAEEVSAPENGIRMLPIDSIRPFRKHPFRLYEGERLEDMVESIREHGVLNPVIVWQKGEEYEMLAGHNRQMAGKLAGLVEIPAIVKTDLTEEDAYVYVIETNVIQRGFAELLPSEKAAVLAERYEKVSSQGRWNDILEEIARLNGQDTAGTCGHDVHRLKSRDAVGEEYGMTGRNIARYMRVQQLEEPLKERLDEGTLPLVAAVDLSYLSGKEQKVVSGLAEKGKIRLDAKTAKCVRGMAGSVTEKRVLETLDGGKGKKDSAGKSVKLPADVYERLTPRECFRLQGFPDELYERAAAVNSETQLYKQAGNAVTATVAYAVAMALPESRELLAQMEAVWEEFGDSVREDEWKGADGFMPGTAWEDFSDSVRDILQEDFSGSIRDTAWNDFSDSVEEIESGKINGSVSDTVWDGFEDMKDKEAGSLSGDSEAGPDEDFDFLN